MEGPRVVVCSIRPEVILPLRMAFADVGVTCVDVRSTDEALMAIAGSDIPPAIIVDQSDFDDDARGLADQVRAYDEDVPVLFLGVDGSAIDSQASAFESGGAGFFKLPVDVGKVVAKLSVYLGCALPEIRGATLPGFRLHGQDDLPDPPSLDDVPVSGEGEPTSLFDLDRSDIDREALSDSFDGDHVVQRDLGGGSFGATASGEAESDAFTGDEYDDVFSSSGVDAASSEDLDVTRPLRHMAAPSAEDDHEPQEANDIRERVARLRKSQAAKSGHSGSDEGRMGATRGDENTTQIGDGLDDDAKVTALPGGGVDQVPNTGEFLSLASESESAVSGGGRFPSADDFDDNTQLVNAMGTDDISSAIDDVVIEESHGSTPLPATMFDQDVTRPPEAEDVIAAAIEEAHVGSDPYAQKLVDDDGMMSALDEAQESVERYAKGRTQDGPPVDDDRTPESEGSALDDELIEHARVLAEEEARRQIKLRLEEDRQRREAKALQEQARDAELAAAAEAERQERLAAQRERISEEAKAIAEQEIAEAIAAEERARAAELELERAAIDAEREQRRLQLEHDAELELTRVREEATLAAKREADATIAAESARLQAEADAAKAALDAEREASDEEVRALQLQLEDEKQRVIDEAKANAQAEIDAKLAESRDAMEARRVQAAAEAKRVAAERERLDEAAREAFDLEKARIADEIAADAAAELERKLAEEKREADAAEENARALFSASVAKDEAEQAKREAEEREQIANAVLAEEREKMEAALAEARATFDAQLRERQQAHAAAVAERAAKHAAQLEATRAETAENVRQEIAMQTQARLEQERQAADAANAQALADAEAEREALKQQEALALAEAERDATDVAKAQAQAEAEAMLDAARQKIADEAKATEDAERAALDAVRQALAIEQERAVEAAEKRVRDEVFAAMRAEQDSALQQAETESSQEIATLRSAHEQRQLEAEREHAEILERARASMLETFERELREEREAQQLLRAAREEEYRRRAEDEALAMRAAHEEAMRLASEQAAASAAERLAAEEEAALAERETEDRQLKERVAYRAGLFGATNVLDVTDADLDGVGSEQWVEGKIATAAQGGAPYPDAGAAPLSPPDVPLNYVAMEPGAGDYSDGELGAVLFSATFLGVTGALTISHPDGRRRTLFFEDGSPVAMASELAQDRPEEHLLRAGLITTARYEELRTGPSLSARRLCALLVTEGAMQSDELFSSVRGVLAEQILSVLEWERGTYLYAEERCHPGDRVRLSSPFDHLIAEGLRRKFDEHRLWNVLGGPSTILAPDDRALRLPPLGPGEKRAMALFDGARSIEDVVLESGATAMVTLRAALIAVSCGAAKLAARGIARPRDAAVVDEAAQETDRARIVDRLRLARHGDYFSFLGVTERATAYEVRAAADRLRHRYDPARMNAPALQDLRAALAEIREVIDDAEAVLGDDDLRKSYRLHHVQ